MGKLIVIEGLDGCGKATQASLLVERFRSLSAPVRYVDFPDYESPSSSLVKMYLNGEFGERANSVNAYAASSFYAVDRYASYCKSWRDDYCDGKLIVANRYTTANAIYQMCKMPQHQWDGFIEWLFDYEYNKLGLPEPSLVIQLRLPVNVSQKLLTGRYSDGAGKKDIHERDLDYLCKCYSASEYMASNYGWSVVDCSHNGEICSKEEIARSVWKAVVDSTTKDGSIIGEI